MKNYHLTWGRFAPIIDSSTKRIFAMSCHYNESAMESCYEEACEAAYEFFPEADWEGEAFNCWIDWKSNQLFSELPDGPF